MLKKVLLTALFAVSFGITQAHTNTTRVLVAVKTKAVGSTARPANLNEPNSIVSEVIGFARKHLSIRYRAGGTTPKGFDCSGFTRFCFSKFGINLPHSSAAQGSVGQKVDQESARPGDLIFFKGHSADGDGIGHVGLITDVVGKQIKFIHSAWGGGIRFDHLQTAYYRNRFVSIRRVARLMAEE